MRSLIPGLLIGGISISILCAGACGGSTNDTPAAADASSDAPIRFETAPPDDDAGGPTYVPLTTKCIAGPYSNPVSDPDGSVNFITDDAGDEDAGIPDGVPQLVSQGGTAMKSPRIIPITYPGDDLVGQIEDFSQSIGCTPYWQTVVSEYGVGQAQMLTPVHLATAAPTTITDQAIASFLLKQIAAKAPGFTDPPTDVIYAFFFPTGTSITLDGEPSCQSFGGYHSSTMYAGAIVSYAVIPRCNQDDFTTVSSAASHEFVEAVTDPAPEGAKAAYVLPDSNHIAFSMLGGGEAGDLCEFSRTADFTPTGYPFLVQRTWSNASILAGHDPCVPAQPGPFLSGIPDQPDNVPVSYIPGTSSTRGVAIPVGGTRVIDIHFHTDDPTVTSWTISASDAARFTGDSPHLTLALDTTTATVGQVAHLTITRNSQSTTYGAEPFIIRSTSATKTSSSWVGLVGSP